MQRYKNLAEYEQAMQKWSNDNWAETCRRMDVRERELIINDPRFHRIARDMDDPRLLALLLAYWEKRQAILSTLYAGYGFYKEENGEHVPRFYKDYPDRPSGGKDAPQFQFAFSRGGSIFFWGYIIRFYYPSHDNPQNYCIDVRGEGFEAGRNSTFSSLEELLHRIKQKINDPLTYHLT